MNNKVKARVEELEKQIEKLEERVGNLEGKSKLVIGDPELGDYFYAPYSTFYDEIDLDNVIGMLLNYLGLEIKVQKEEREFKIKKKIIKKGKNEKGNK